MRYSDRPFRNESVSRLISCESSSTASGCPMSPPPAAPSPSTRRVQPRPLIRRQLQVHRRQALVKLRHRRRPHQRDHRYPRPSAMPAPPGWPSPRCPTPPTSKPKAAPPSPGGRTAARAAGPRPTGRSCRAAAASTRPASARVLPYVAEDLPAGLANEVASPVRLPISIAPRLSALTSRRLAGSVPIMRYFIRGPFNGRHPSLGHRARSKSN
jgi:hypothetical protein